jgi:thioredoxin 1
MPSKNVLHPSVHDFDEQIARASVPALVDFTAAWCAPCKTIAPHIDAIADQYAGTLRVAKVDVEENRELAQRYDVRSMPTLLLLRDGAVVDQIVGAVPRARIDAMLARAGVAR